MNFRGRQGERWVTRLSAVVNALVRWWISEEVWAQNSGEEMRWGGGGGGMGRVVVVVVGGVVNEASVVVDVVVVVVVIIPFR